jgi:hypothetical protein
MIKSVDNLFSSRQSPAKPKKGLITEQCKIAEISEVFGKVFLKSMYPGIELVFYFLNDGHGAGEGSQNIVRQDLEDLYYTDSFWGRGGDTFGRYSGAKDRYHKRHIADIRVWTAILHRKK